MDTTHISSTVCQIHSTRGEKPLKSRSIDEQTAAEDLPQQSVPEISKIQKYCSVLGTFIVFFNTWGLLLSYGPFQSFYIQSLLTSSSQSKVAWISTICGFLVPTGGLITGGLFDAGYLRPLYLVGSLLQITGLMLLSLSQEYYQIFLTQGICIGLGGAMLYVPAIAATASCFDDISRPIAMGIASAGSGIGGVIYPIIFQKLVERIGFPWTIRVIGFLVLITYISSFGILLFPGTRGTTVRRWIDLRALSESQFVCLLMSGFCIGLSYYVPLLYIPQFAETHIPSRPPGFAFFTASIINGASVLGRLVTGIIAAKIGVMETFIGSVFACSLLLLCWIAVNSVAGIVVWCIMWGIIYSTLVTLPGAFIPLLSPSITVVGTRIGMYWAAAGLGILVGGPISGAVLEISLNTVTWWHLQLLVGLFMFTAFLFLIWPTIHVRRKSNDLGKR